MYKSTSCTFSAELLGTFVLMFIGLGTAVLAGEQVGYVGIALAFGFALTIMTYSLGNASGAHLNPAVSFGMLFAGRMSFGQFARYIIAQLLGAGIAAYAVLSIAKGTPEFSGVGNFASTGYGEASPGGYNIHAAFMVEAIGTGILTLVAICTQSSRFPRGLGGIAMGLTLTAVLLVAIPVTNGSINPARSFASAIIEHGTAMQQLGFFFMAPAFGALVIGLMSRCCMRSCCDEECVDSKNCGKPCQPEYQAEPAAEKAAPVVMAAESKPKTAAAKKPAAAVKKAPAAKKPAAAVKKAPVAKKPAAVAKKAPAAKKPASKPKAAVKMKQATKKKATSKK